MSGSNKCYEEKNSERIDNGGGMLFQTGLSEKNYLKSHLSRDLKEVKKKKKDKTNHASIRIESVPGRGNIRSKGPKIGRCLENWRTAQRSVDEVQE